jgi:putative nucleotidyltransferase with HDIG domain
MRKADVWPVRALLYPFRHIRWKIIAPFAVLTLLVAAIGSFMVTRLVSGSLEERFENQLTEASRVTADSVVRRERKHLEAVRSISFTQGVATAAQERDQAQLARLIEPIVANAGLERVEVLDADGDRVFGVRLLDYKNLLFGPIQEPDNRDQWRSVQHVLARDSDDSGDKYAGINNTADGHALYTAGPLYDGDRFVGVVLIGSLVETFLPVAKGEALADITLYTDDGAPIASTFATDASLPEPRAGALEKGPAREQLSLFGREYDLLYSPLIVRGEEQGYYSVALPLSFVFSANASTQSQLAVLFALATASVLFVGWFIARSITTPVTKLVAAANAVAAGDLQARSNVRGRDEIGVLGVAFDAMTERLQKQHLSTIRALTSAIDARDPYTMGHSLRVGQLSVEIGRELDVAPVLLQHLEVGGYLHDIGKIGVRDAVLLKPGELTLSEREAIERHPTIGLEILDAVDLPKEVLEFVGGHHEKLDGRGYPGGLSEHEIGVVPRIATVADIYDALTTDRPYRAGMSVERAIEILSAESEQGKLDRRMVQALERVLPAWQRRLANEPALKGYRLPTNGFVKAA